MSDTTANIIIIISLAIAFWVIWQIRPQAPRRSKAH